MSDFLQSLKNVATERPNCEALSGFQVFNLFTNVAYFIAAWSIFRSLNRHSVRDNLSHILAYTTVVIGLGSISHHAIPNNFTLLLDGLPIILFSLLFLSATLRYLTNNRNVLILSVLTFLVLQILLSGFLVVPFDPSFIVFIVNIALFAIPLALLYRKYRFVTKHILLGLGYFALASLALYFDETVCSAFPIGIHFLWHISSATATYHLVSIVVLIESERKNISR